MISGMDSEVEEIKPGSGRKKADSQLIKLGMIKLFFISIAASLR